MSERVFLVDSHAHLDADDFDTDSPYLVPVPHRNSVKRNEPAYVREVALVLAALKQILLPDLAEAVLKNFQSLFQSLFLSV